MIFKTGGRESVKYKVDAVRIEPAKVQRNMATYEKTARNRNARRFVSNLALHKEGIQAKPFLKWAGGKGQLLSEIDKYYCFSDANLTRYVEPFVGGGAVLFDVLSKFEMDFVYISDVNDELINAYQMIKNHVDDVIALLLQYQDEFLPLEQEERKKYYSNMRLRFNELKMVNEDVRNVEKAALLIFLNRTCFNGLYRVNRKGFFNVPMGAYKKPHICDVKNLKAVAEKLRQVKIFCGDYRESEKFIDKQTFVYFDPPYRPLSQTASFTAYTENLFDDESQKQLAQYVNQLNKKGAKIVVSNSDPKNENDEDDFFDRLYEGYRIRRVEAHRMINSDSNKRGKIRELLISNF